MKFELVMANHWPFHAGEIMIVPAEYEREALGAGRKSSKWDVSTRWFDTAAEAVAAARAEGLDPRVPDDYPYRLSALDACRELLAALPR